MRRARGKWRRRQGGAARAARLRGGCFRDAGLVACSAHTPKLLGCCPTLPSVGGLACTPTEKRQRRHTPCQPCDSERTWQLHKAPSPSRLPTREIVQLLHRGRVYHSSALAISFRRWSWLPRASGTVLQQDRAQRRASRVVEARVANWLGLNCCEIANHSLLSTKRKMT